MGANDDRRLAMNITVNIRVGTTIFDSPRFGVYLVCRDASLPSSGTRCGFVLTRKANVNSMCYARERREGKMEEGIYSADVMVV